MLLLLLGLAPIGATHAEEKWRTALRQMPLAARSETLARSNCLPVLLGAFQSNHVVKALVVLPGVSNDFYLLNRDRPLNLATNNLADALAALAASTSVRVTFREPFLLLHTANDKLKPATTSFSSALMRSLRGRCSAPQVLLVDRHWDGVQPWLARMVKLEVTPEPASTDAWHFARHNLAAWQLNDWELLCALSLSGGTKFTLGKDRLRFEQRGTPPRALRFSQPALF
jgi:hypothetical protein